MKKIFGLAAVLAAMFLVLNGYVTEASNQDSFWSDAAQSGMAEVALGDLALQKSQNADVKQYAQMIVDDHTAANQELQTLAAGKNITLPTEMSAKQRASHDKLNGLTGAEFDKEFMKVMVKDHEKAVKMFQKQSEKGTDADLKAFAAKTLPTLQGHLTRARALSGTSSGNSNTMMHPNMNTNSNSNSNSNTNSNSNRP